MATNELGKLLRAKRGEKSLREFAEFLGISHAYLDSLEKGFEPKTGKKINVGVDTLNKIASKLNLEKETILDIINDIDYQEALQSDILIKKMKKDFSNIITQKDLDKPDDEDLFEWLDSNELTSDNSEPKDEVELLFDKHKDILTQDDKDYIKFIIEKRKKEIDKELGEE